MLITRILIITNLRNLRITAAPADLKNYIYIMLINLLVNLKALLFTILYKNITPYYENLITVEIKLNPFT